MLKPGSLRALLLKALPELSTDPDKLVVMVRGGQLLSTMTEALAYEYQYTLEVTVLDYAGHADSVMLPVLIWLREHQPELLDNPELRDKSIQFDVEFLNGKTVDLGLSLKGITERVVVRPKPDAPDTHVVTHLPEPVHPAVVLRREHWEFFLGDDLLAQWDRDPR